MGDEEERPRHAGDKSSPRMPIAFRGNDQHSKTIDNEDHLVADLLLLSRQ